MAQLLDFTSRNIAKLVAPATGRAEYKDTQEQGLYLRVTAKGAMSFSFVGRAKGSARVERLTLGKYPQVKPDEARRQARELAGQLAGGTSVAAAQRKKRGEMTMEELWKLYHEHLKATTKDPESQEIVWNLYVLPFWGKRRLSDVSGLEIEKWHREIPGQIVKRRADKAEEIKRQRHQRRAEVASRQAIRRRGPDPLPLAEPKAVSKKVTGKVTANRALAQVRAMFNFATNSKRKYFDGQNPAAGQDFFPEPARSRFIRPNEFRPFFEALASEHNETQRDALTLSLLTAQRRENVIAMRWQDVDLELAEWRIPGEVMKNGDPHVHPMLPEVVAILTARKEAAAQAKKKSEWVFPSSRSETGHIGEPRSAWKRLMKASGLNDLIIHDLRRTMGSWQARNGASLVMIGKGLNHKSPEATAIYAQLDLDPVRQQFESAAGAMYEAAGLRPSANVISIEAAAEAKRSAAAGKG